MSKRLFIALPVVMVLAIAWFKTDSFLAIISLIAAICTIVGKPLIKIVKGILRWNRSDNLIQKISEWRQENKKLKELRGKAKAMSIPSLEMWDKFLKIMQPERDFTALSQAVEAGYKIIDLSAENRTNVDTMMEVFLGVMRREIDTETVKGIVTSNLSRVHPAIDDIAHDLRQFFRGGHLELGPNHCCSKHFNVVNFSTVHSPFREALALEITQEYRGKGISKIFYLRRIKPTEESVFVQIVGTHLGVDVIPIIETERWGMWGVERGTKILIIDEMIMNDNFLDRIIHYSSSNLGVDIEGLVIVFDVKGSIHPSTIEVDKIKSLITLDLEVSELGSEHCDYCKIGCPVEVYY